MAETFHVSQPADDKDRLSTMLVAVVVGLMVVVLVATLSLVVFLRQHGGQPRSVPELAVARAETGVSENPQDADAWVRLAYAYAGADRFGDAQRALDEGTKLGESPLLDLAQADILRIEGKNGQAIEVYTVAISSGEAALKKSAKELAKKDIRVARPETNLDQAYYGRALSRKAAGDLKGAIADVRSALKYAPNAADLQILLGDYLAEAGDKPAAAAAYKAALRFLPDSVEARQGLQRVGGR